MRIELEQSYVTVVSNQQTLPATLLLSTGRIAG